MANLSKIGSDCALYYDASPGDPASRNYSLITNAIDVELTLGKNTATFASRAGTWEASACAHKTLEVSFGYEYQTSTATEAVDAVMTALMSAYMNNTTLRWIVADGAIDGSVEWTGLEFYGEVSEFAQSQPLQDAVTFNTSVVGVRYVYSGTLYEAQWVTENGAAGNTA